MSGSKWKHGVRGARWALLLALGLLSTAAMAAAAPGLLTAVVRTPAGGSSGKPLYVGLHGLGSDEQDLAGLAPLLPRDAVFASLRAPFMLVPGHYAWFAPRRVAGRMEGDPAQIRTSEQAVLRTVDALVAKYHVDPHRIVVFGFSQGAIMSDDLALAAPRKFEGIGVLSGALFDSVKQRLGAAREPLPIHIFIAHGLADPRIPVRYAREGADWWKAQGAQVELHLYPGMQHQIGEQEIRDFGQWLQRQ